MAVILTPDKWRRQPSGSVAIDYSHPAAPGLVHLTLPSVELIDLASGGQWEQWSGTNAVARTAGSGGNAWKPSGSTNSFIYRADSAANSVSKIIAVSVVETAAGIGDYAPLTKRVYFDKGWMLNVRFSGLKSNDYPCLAFFDGVGWRSTTGTRDIRGTGPRTLVGSYDGATLRCFVDGISDGETAFAGSIPDTAGRVEVVGYGEYSAVGLVYGSYLIDATKVNASAELVREISRAPYAIFRKQPRILYFTAPSGGGATIAGDSGTYTLTGAAVTLKAGRKLAADSGTYSLTGTAAALRVGRKLAADSGSYSLSGTDAAFKRGYALVASSGTYTVSGTAVSLKAGRKLAADSGSYTLTGTDATLTYAPAGSYSLTAESGSYSLTGTAATLRVSRKLSADSGAYSLTGTTATLAKGVRMAAASGSYTLTGSNVSFARTYVLTAESGSYTLTGTSAGLTWSGAPVVEVPTNGGPSIYGKPVFREAEFKREYEREVSRIEAERFRARQMREDEELVIIMAALAA